METDFMETFGSPARLYKEGDEVSILRLFESVFKSRTIKHWNWKFRENLYGNPIIYVIEEDEKIVGHYSGLPYHINFLGKEIPATQGIDAMVHADYQGKGYFKILAASVYNLSRDYGFKIVWGFPNQNSFPIVMKEFWENIGNLKVYYRRIGFKKLFKISWLDRAAKIFIKLFNLLQYDFLKWKLGKINIETYEKVPNEIEAIWNKYKYCEIFSVWKDIKYLRWRYDSHPENKYSYHLIYKNKEPLGYAISRLHADNVLICEMVHASKNVNDCQSIIRYIVDRYTMKDYQNIIFYGLDEGFYESVLGGCGFKSSWSNIGFGGVAFGQSKLSFMFPFSQNWTISYGDMDII
jgi:predicted acetyltransferase